MYIKQITFLIRKYFKYIKLVHIHLDMNIRLLIYISRVMGFIIDDKTRICTCDVLVLMKLLFWGFLFACGVFLHLYTPECDATALAAAPTRPQIWGRFALRICDSARRYVLCTPIFAKTATATEISPASCAARPPRSRR